MREIYDTSYLSIVSVRCTIPKIADAMLILDVRNLSDNKLGSDVEIGIIILRGGRTIILMNLSSLDRFPIWTISVLA